VAEQTARLAGDFVECGVNRGANARMIIEYLAGISSFETHRMCRPLTPPRADAATLSHEGRG
jgi:hypothetical protein